MVKKTKKQADDSILPHVNWEVLFDEWIARGAPHKYQFLRDKGLDPLSKGSQKQMELWEKGVAKIVDSIHADFVDQVQDATAITDKGLSAWEIIQKFREAQARADFRRSNMLAKHVENQLAGAWEKVQIKDEVSGEVFFEEFKSTISANNLKHLAEVSEKIQRIQRLALGLTTENMGIDQPSTTDTTVEKKEDSKGPVFIVEVNNNGKFVNPKPKRVE